MTREQAARVQLAARAEVTDNLVRQAEQRWARLRKRFAPVRAARKQLQALYGPDTDPNAHPDVVLALIARNGGDQLSREDFAAFRAMLQEVGELVAAAAEAWDALTEAMERDGHEGTVLEWVGVSEAEYDVAVMAELRNATR